MRFSKPAHILLREEAIPLTDPAYQQCISPACGATYCDRRSAGRLRPLRRPAGRGVRLGPAAACPRRWPTFEKKWARRDDPHCFSGVWRFHDLLPFVRGRAVRHGRRRADPAAPVRRRRPATSARSPAGCSCNTRG